MQNSIVDAVTPVVFLRPARLRDLDAIVAVHAAAATTAYADIFDGPFPREQARKMRRKQLTRGRGVVAEVDGRVVGFAIVGRDGELNGLYVLPELWRTGIGSRLLAAVPEARTLSVLRENPIGRAFYERHAWEPEGTAHEGPEGAVELRYRRS
jgi:GNAT superfamily N-acetyltransferase